MGGVSASAPFGTTENVTQNGRNLGTMYGSKVSPFGTDDNEYIKYLPRNDHRNNGKSMNAQISATTYKKIENHEVKHTTNCILILREKLVKRGVRSWFNLFKNLKM